MLLNKCPREFTKKMSTKIHPKRGLLVDKSVHEKTPKSVHEKSPFENVHENSPILKKSVHVMSLSTKCLHHVGTHNADTTRGSKLGYSLT